MLKSKLKKKIALSGFDRRIAEDLQHVDLSKLYNEKTNMKVIKGKKCSNADDLTRKKLIRLVDSDINPGHPTIAKIVKENNR